MKLIAPHNCPHCRSTHFHRKGHYYVQALKAYRKRYFCQVCRKSFSTQTHSPTYKQRRPDLNTLIRKLLLNGVSQRGAARFLECSKTTVEKKFKWLSTQAEIKPIFETPAILFIDEMESIEHTKLKPITIPLAVTDQYEILCSRVGRVPSKGHLSKWAMKKYGPRKNERERILRELFAELKVRLPNAPAVIRTDASPIYQRLVREHFPESKHEVFVSRNQKKSREETYLSLAKKKYDPLFPLNQRCAKLRADIKRLCRRSWCTTKRPENLALHLKLYEAHQFGSGSIR